MGALLRWGSCASHLNPGRGGGPRGEMRGAGTDAPREEGHERARTAGARETTLLRARPRFTSPGTAGSVPVPALAVAHGDEEAVGARLRQGRRSSRWRHRRYSTRTSMRRGRGLGITASRSVASACTAHFGGERARRRGRPRRCRRRSPRRRRTRPRRCRCRGCAARAGLRPPQAAAERRSSRWGCRRRAAVRARSRSVPASRPQEGKTPRICACWSRKASASVKKRAFSVLVSSTGAPPRTASGLPLPERAELGDHHRLGAMPASRAGAAAGRTPRRHDVDAEQLDVGAAAGERAEGIHAGVVAPPSSDMLGSSARMRARPADPPRATAAAGRRRRSRSRCPRPRRAGQEWWR